LPMTRKWTALVPFGAIETAKSRLALALSPEERKALAMTMLEHVVSVLHASPSIGDVIMLSNTPLIRTIGVEDFGDGLNAGLERVRSSLDLPLLVLHGDLPLLEVEDIEAICRSAQGLIVVALDRHKSGTNAIAIDADIPFKLMFGENSAFKHLSQSGPDTKICQRQGFCFDIDTPDDLMAAQALGFEWRS
jgi:2-phospho-L-lactate/phosphoenolpyruvate guanylyltransferase